MFKNTYIAHIILFLLFVGVIVVNNTTTIFAQELPGDIFIQISPEFPTPDDSITLTLKTSAMDLKTALITWYINNEMVLQSHGANSYTFTSGAIGSTYDVSITAVSAAGRTITSKERITVSAVSIVWEADTYTPPYFLGRALQTDGAAVTLLALPTILDKYGHAYDSSELFYDWQTQGNITSQKVGKGNNSITIRTEHSKNNISGILTIKDPAGNIRIRKKIAVPKTSPKLIFYENNPLLGIQYHQALADSYTIHAKETSIIAEPLYLSAESRDDITLDYTWEIAGATYEYPGTILLRPETGAGSETLSVSVVNSNFMYQRIESRLKIYFNSDTAISPDTKPL